MKLKPEHKRLQGLLVSALEGGSNYWYRGADCDLAPGIEYSDLQPSGKFADPDDYFHPLQIAPFVPGCSISFLTHEDDDTTRHSIDATKLAAALKLMHDKYPHHYANVITDNDDAETGDVLLQLAAFGELVYG